MPGMNDLRDVFLHELDDILFAERRIVEMLERLHRSTDDAELRDGFARHLEQTRGHVAKLEQAFDLLGTEAPGEHGPAIAGIDEEYAAHERSAAAEVRDVVNASAAARTEHYEISLYEGLIPKGEALEVNEVVALLWENLRDEKEALQEVNTVVERLATVRAPGSAMP